MSLVTAALKNEFETRRSRNTQYSLRAFARYLDLDPPTLSKILNNKKNPGPKLSRRLLARLPLTPTRQRELIKSCIKLENLKVTDESRFLVLQDDEFQTLRNWYYYAILEILELRGFQPSPGWIANRLGISLNEAKIALERLERQGLIERIGKTWRDKTGGRTTALSSELTTNARREHQRQILQKSIDALESIDPSLRDQTSMTFAIDSADIPHVKELIKEFRRKVSAYVNEAKSKNEVYNLSISFYPVTKKTGEIK